MKNVIRKLIAFIRPIEFEECVFDGSPPLDYRSWSEWCASHPKKGVIITAIQQPLEADDEDDYVFCTCQFEGDGCAYIGVEESCGHPNRKNRNGSRKEE